jgi:hypothetical protein
VPNQLVLSYAASLAIECGELQAAERLITTAIDKNELTKEAFWPDQSILTLGSSIKFVAEVVSSNWQNDYSLDTLRAEAAEILLSPSRFAQTGLHQQE